MIGVILLAATWLLLRLEGKDLSAIGVDHGLRRLAEFAAGFTLLGLAATAQQLGLAAATNDPFVVNAEVSSGTLLEGARFVVNSVLYEELLFRGYLLYHASRWLGSVWAVWLDAVAFGIYHWFSYDAFGNPIAMAYIFVLTAAYGLMWARAFVATGSVAAPIGLHLGWNAVTQLVFSAGPLGAALLVPASGVQQIQASGWSAVGLSIVWPLTVTGGVLWLCRRYERQRSSDSSTRQLT